MTELDCIDAGSGGNPYPGASSTEDFWMFFSFSMILLVFVLMNYVSYLYSMVVKPPAELPATELVVADDLPAEAHDIRIYVKADAGLVYYVFADDETTALDRTAMAAGLRRRVAETPAADDIRVFVHAPGRVLYQDVFDASYAAWQLAARQGAAALDVHLVYEELE